MNDLEKIVRGGTSLLTANELIMDAVRQLQHGKRVMPAIELGVALVGVLYASNEFAEVTEEMFLALDPDEKDNS